MPSAILERSRMTWDGERTPNTIYEVWDLIGLRLRDVKERLRNIMDEFYGKDERINYLCNIHEALKVASDHDKSLHKVGNFMALEQLLKLSPESSIRPRLLQKALDLLGPYLDRTKLAVVKLAETREMFQRDVLKHLETFCSSYVKLGIADDHFYRALKSRTIKIRGMLRNFEKISVSLKQSLIVSKEYFCDFHFSQELSLQFNCDKFSIIRIVPDLFQKLEMVIDTGQDWLRSDKVYMDQIKKEIENTHIRLKDCEMDLQREKLEYDQLFLMVKQKQMEMDHEEEDRDAIWKELSNLEVKKTKLEMEIAAVSKTLRSCRDQLRDLASVERPSSDSDDVDGYDHHGHHDPHNRISHTHSSYKSRLCKDARTHNIKLDYIRRKKKHIERKIIQKREVLKDLEENESDIQRLGKKLKSSSRKKSKYSEEISTQKGLLETLEQTLKKRLRPTHSANMARILNTSQSRTRPGHGTRRVSHRSKKVRSKRAEELSKAFRLVKNNIGYNWKDLARCLPYGEKKELTEIDNEIRVIEYENQGQLKEQAYQSLLKWYSHVGRRASVDLLNGALRDIDQNRLADSIEKEVSAKSSPDASEAEATQK